MPLTTSDLAAKVGRELKITAAGEPLEAHDYADIVADYRSIVQELETRGVAAWLDDKIPEKAFFALAEYIAARLAYSYGRPYKMADREAYANLMRVMAKPPSGEPLKVNYF